MHKIRIYVFFKQNYLYINLFLFVRLIYRRILLRLTHLNFTSSKNPWSVLMFKLSIPLHLLFYDMLTILFDKVLCDL